MAFTHISLLNQYHIYSIKNDKIIRDDFLTDFNPRHIIEKIYYPLPELTIDETKAIIIDLRQCIGYEDMVRGFLYNLNLKRVTSGDKTKKVKDLLKFVKRENFELHL